MPTQPPQSDTRSPLTSSGDGPTLHRMMPAVLVELRALAARYLRNERKNHTLQPTELVHEAYLKLADQGGWESRTHFFAVAASAVRQVLVDYARSHRSIKRGEGRRHLTLHDFDVLTPEPSIDILALDDALRELASLNERQHRVVEMRFFGGLTTEEIARVLGVTDRTVKSDWRAARAWLIGTFDAAEGP